MTVSTLRPNATTSTTGTVVGSSAHAALSDDSDSTYVELTALETLETTFGDLTLPAGAVVVKADVRVRSRRHTSSGVAVIEVGIWTSEGPFQTATVSATWSDATTTTVTTITSGLSDAMLDDAILRVSETSGWADLYEAFLDVTYAEQPEVAVDSPSGTVTDSNLPAVQWTNTLDAAGGAQTRYEVKVFTDAQYGAGGFDPDTSDPFDTSAIVSSAATSWTPTVVQPDDTYRAYVRVAQTVNGSLHWSDWEYAEYTVDVALPAVPTVVATADNADASITVEVTGNSGTATTDDLEIQRSIDGGVTWEPVRLTTDTAGIVDAADATIVDFEAPNGTTVHYRARARHDYSGVYAASAWATDTAAWSSTDWWLKCPESPALNAAVKPHSVPSAQRPARQGVFQPVGRTRPVVVSDTRGGWRGTITFRVMDAAARDEIDALLDSGAVLLLQAPEGEHWPDRYLRFGDQDRQRWIDKAWVEPVLDTLPWVEVDTPAGVVDEWPETGS